MEELLLRGVLPADEVHIIDKEEIGLAIALAEVVHRPLADGGDDVVGELLGGDVGDARLWGADEDLVRDRLHEMRLPEPGGAVEEERVIGLPGGLGHSHRRRRGKVIGLADYEGLKGVPLIQCAERYPTRPPLWRETGLLLTGRWHKEVHLGAL